ncbi:MAG: TonB-dependent receptor [Fimbriimonadaceae bacterium]|nr:TonB-dependent receptor [Chitinophagales bacterium]
MKKIILFLLIVQSTAVAFSQVKISGYIIDSSSNKAIEGAIVIFKESDNYIASDSSGYFNIELNKIEIPYAYHLAYDFVITKEDLNSINKNNEFAYLIYMTPRNMIFREIIITGTRADYHTPITTTNISGSELNKNNFGEDMPQLIEFTPGVVVTSDAGNGVGYTGIRIRGSDATRVNVTLNGVPYNDAESQQTYWVDIPDFAESVDDIQIQRGVGTSQNGISSLGGAINIYTNKLEEKPFRNISFGVGSFNLLKASAAFGTGRIHDNWFLEGRISKINSDGFIDRSFADLTSFAITAAYKTNKYSSILNIFSGEERTYQSWGGVPKDLLETNRTFNPYTYENQTDNYTQTHYQWHNTLYFKKDADITLTLNYTKGKGYYEQFEQDQFFSDYAVNDFIFSGDTVFTSDLITQKWLDSDFYGAYLQYNKQFRNNFDLSIGAAAYQHTGDHFGKVIWSEYATQFGYNYEWYRNDATKNDANVYVITNYNINEKLLSYVDLQLRTVDYSFLGYDENANPVDQNVDLLFFNPKLGFSYSYNSKNLSYLSFAKSGKEPNRDDYTESSPNSRPSPEIVYDIEAGHKLNLNGWQLQANIYYMYYIDQLVLRGEINDVGAYTRTNVPESYRTGIELSWARTFADKLNWKANAAFSKNVINEHTTFIDNWDTGEQISETFTETEIAFSPSLVASNSLEFIFLNKESPKIKRGNRCSIALQSKYVSRQFIDNTSNAGRSLDQYLVSEIILFYTHRSETFRELNLGFTVQNILDNEYESNAWVYLYVYEGVEREMNGYFPQAGRNFAAVLRILF